jgi:hypothetical protein
MHVGNGNNKKTFWEARWLHGGPKELAPNLYRLARFRKRSVHVEMKNSNWIRNLQDIDTPNQMEEFTMLFMALELVCLNDQDSTRWRWTANGAYSVASTYDCQFLRVMINFPATNIWRTKTE